MKLRPNYESRMPTLLRLAPYIDIAEVHKRMIRAVKWTLKNKTIRSFQQESFEAFVAGEGYVIPMAHDLHNKLYKILERLAGDNRHDRLFHSAYHEFRNYFFRTNDQLGIYE